MESNDAKRTIIAIPVSDGELCPHFGHCQQFAFFDVDLPEGKIHRTRHMDAPPHEPGLLPQWVRDQNASLVIAGGMGRRAQDRFREHGIEVIVGAPANRPEDVVEAYLNGRLNLAGNLCDH